MTKKLGLVQTGGTIAAVKGPQGVDFAIGDAIVGLLGIEAEEYEIITRQPYKILSENANTNNWQMAAECVAELVNAGVDGVVVTHGTDTMTYIASALSYMLRPLPVPVILTGSMLSSDDPETDGRPNLAWSIRAAMHVNAPHEVALMFGGGATSVSAYYIGTNNFNNLYQAERLDEILIRGSRVKKVSAWPEYFKPAEKRYAAFQSIHSDLLGAVVDNHIIFNETAEHSPASAEQRNQILKAQIGLDAKVISLRIYPGFDPQLIVHLAGLGYRGIILEGYGDGTIPSGKEYSLLSSVAEVTKQGVCVCITSSVLGPATTGVYAGSNELTDIGAVPLLDMTTEGAIVKLMWVLGNSRSIEETRSLMQLNLAGEISITK